MNIERSVGFQRTITYLALCLVILLTNGCASIIKGTKGKIAFTTEPAGAKVCLSSGQTGTTPTEFVLPKKQERTTFTVTKAGFCQEKGVIAANASSSGIALTAIGIGAYFSPMIIDIINKSYRDFDQTEFNIKLRPNGTLPNTDPSPLKEERRIIYIEP